MIEIFDINDKRIELYRSMKGTPQSHLVNHVFVAEGERVVKKLLESNLSIVSVFALDDYFNNLSDLIKQKNISEDKLFTASKDIMNEIIGYRLHKGIMAIAEQPIFINININNLSNRIIYLNSIVNSENVGAISRNTAAFGFDSIIFDRETSSPYLRRAVRVSMGTVFGLKIAYSEGKADLIKLKQMGYRIISSEITENAISIDSYNFPEKYVLVFGNESYGISEKILEISDDIIYVPINPEVPSINVAACGAVIMREAAKQIIK